jgi:hypothetical protein
MKVKFGAIVTDGRNKVGGQVFSKNRGGNYLKNKVSPSQPHTSMQSVVRQRLATLATAWRALTADQRNQWNAAVSSWTKTDVFGDVKTPSGFNLFQRLNNNLAQVGVAMILIPPTPGDIPVITGGVLSATHAGVIKITFTVDPVVTSCDLVLSGTGSLSAGIGSTPARRKQLGIAPAIVAHVLDFSTLYNAKYGAVGAAGQKIFIMAKMINRITGQAGNTIIWSGINL